MKSKHLLIIGVVLIIALMLVLALLAIDPQITFEGFQRPSLNPY